MGFIQTITDPVFNPLLALGPLGALLVASFVLSLLITLIYKLLTDQEEMGRLRAELKSSQARMRELRGNPEQALQVQKEAMAKNMEYMKHSFKPTLVTFIPAILVLAWLGAHLAFEPIMPGDQFTVDVLFDGSAQGTAALTAKSGLEVVGAANATILSLQSPPAPPHATFALKAVEPGEHFFFIDVNGKSHEKSVLVTAKREYTEQAKQFRNSPVKVISINYEKLKPLGSLSLFGWQPGWLGLYIIFSLIFSLVLRKLMKLH